MDSSSSSRSRSPASHDSPPAAAAAAAAGADAGSSSIAAVARAISPPTPAPSPQPTSNALRLAQAHAHAQAHARAVAAAADAPGPSSALAHSFTAMPSTPPHQEDAKLGPAPGTALVPAASSSPSDVITIGSSSTDRTERTLEGLQAHLLAVFPSLSRTDRLSFLSSLVPLSSARELAHLQSLIIPNLKVDFLSLLPYELSLHILSFIDDPVTLARCSAVSRHWRALVNDEGTWMAMCKKHGRGRSLVPSLGSRRAVSFGSFGAKGPSPQSFSYKQHIKMSYLTDSNWRRGGRLLTQHTSRSSQTVTSLAVDRDWIVVGMASSKIHVFDARTGLYYATLRGHGTGVWALAMVSGSKRREPLGTLEAVPPKSVLKHDDGKRQAVDGDGDTSMADMDSEAQGASAFASSSKVAVKQHEKGKRKSSDWHDDDGPVRGSCSSSAKKDEQDDNAASPFDSTNSPGGHSRTPKPRIDQARSAAELVKMVAAGNAAAASGPSSSASPDVGSSTTRTGGLAETGALDGLFGSQQTARGRYGSSETADGSSSQSSFYEEADGADGSSNSGMSSVSSSVAVGPLSASGSHAGGGGGGSSSARRNRSYPYHSVGDNELKLSFYDSTPCEEMDSLYAAAEDAYAESHPPLPTSPVPRASTEQQRPGYSAASSLMAGIGLGGPSTGFRDAGARAVSAAAASATTPQGQVGSSSSAFLHGAGGSANAYVGGLLGLFAGGDQGAGAGAGPGLGPGGPRYGLFARQERESPSARPAAQRVSFGGLPALPSARDGPFGTSSTSAARRSMAAAGGGGAANERLGLGHPSTSSPFPESMFSHAEEDAAEAKAAWAAAGLPRTGNAVGLGNPCGSSAGFGNEDAIVVSGSCDRDVRVWDLKTKRCKFVLSGHTSTVRCLKVLDGRPIAISGSRDYSLRIWDLSTGQLRHLCSGHTESVRCLEVAGNRVVSGSYDRTGRIWNVETGQCLHILEGHHHQIYAVAFDGRRVATGSLDTTIRVWDADTGVCLSLFTGHTSLVGHLQLRDDILVSGGSDGRVIVFSLRTNECIHRLCAHDNSVTSLQFDDRFIVTGANDGRVKVWDFRTGLLLRELVDITAGAVVWKVSFKDDKVVALYTRDDKTIMDIISFRPAASS